MTVKFWPALGLCVLALSACGKKEEASAPPPAVQEKVEASVPEEVQNAAADAAAAPAPLPLAAAAVDVCALLDRTDVEAVLGKLNDEPKAETPQGSLLGGCNFTAAKAPMTMVSARPAQEYAATVQFAGKKDPTEPVAGLGKEAVMTKYGLMILPNDKPYFITIYTVGAGGEGAKLSRELGAKLKI